MYLFVLAAISTGCGFLIERICGWTEPCVSTAAKMCAPDAVSWSSVPLTLSMIFFFIALVLVIIALMTSLIERSEQVFGKESLRCMLAKFGHRHSRWLVLSDILKNYVGEKYPTLEKEIFASLSQKDLTGLAADFPELQSATTLLEFCKRLQGLYDEMWALAEEIEDTKQAMRYRTQDLWVPFSSFIPKLDEDEFDFILPANPLVSDKPVEE